MTTFDYNHQTATRRINDDAGTRSVKATALLSFISNNKSFNQLIVKANQEVWDETENGCFDYGRTFNIFG